MRRRYLYPALAVLVLGICVRFIGIGWGLAPSAYATELPFHPDEPYNYAAGTSLYEERGPLTFTWGGVLYFRLVWLAAQTLGPEPQSELARMRSTLLHLRLVNLVLAVAAAGLVGLTASRSLPAWAALTATTLMTLFPASVIESHYVRPDILLLFLVSLFLLVADRCLRDQDPRLLFASAVVAGLACGVMLWGLACLPPLLWLIVGQARYQTDGASWRGFARWAGVACVGVIVGYLLASIETLIYWQDFLSGLTRAGAMHASAWQFPTSKLTTVSIFAFSLPFVLLASIGAALAMVHLRSEPLRQPIGIWLAYALGCIALLGLQRNDMMRYVLFMAPAVALLATYALVLLGRKAPTPTVVLGILSGVYLVYLAVGYTTALASEPDIRYRAGRAIADYVASTRPETSVDIALTASFYGDDTHQPRVRPSPQLHPRLIQLRNQGAPEAIVGSWPDFIVTSDYAHTAASNPGAQSLLEGLRSDLRYRLVETYQGPRHPDLIARWLSLPQPDDLYYFLLSFFLYERR